MTVRLSNLTVLLFALLMGGTGRAATYYVSPTGDNSDGLSWATAFNLPSTAVTAGNTDVGGDGPHTMNIAAGTYADNLVLTDADWTNGTIAGAGRDQTTINGSINITMTVQVATSVTVTGMKLTQATADKNVVSVTAGAENFTLRDCDIYCGIAEYLAHAVNISTPGFLIENCRIFRGQRSTVYAFRSAATAGGTLRNLQIAPADGQAITEGISLNGSGAVNVYNCVIVGCGGLGVNVTAGTVNIANCIIQGGCRTGGAAISRTGGTVSATNNLLFPPAWQGDLTATSGTLAADSGNIVAQYPRWRTPARIGYILPRVDDSGSFDYAQLVAAKLAEYDMRGTYFLHSGPWDSENTPALRTLITDGQMEVGSHTRSHTSLYYTHALAIAYTGTDTNPTVELTAGRVLQFRTTEGNDNFDLDTTAAAYDTLGELTAADAHNFGIAYSTTDGQNASLFGASCLATSLAVTAATPVPCDIDFDRTGIGQGYFKDEIADPKTDIAALVNDAGNIVDPQTGQTYACRTFAAPYHDLAPDARAAVIAAGYMLGCGEAQGTEPIGALAQLVDVDLYTMSYIAPVDRMHGQDEATIRQAARAMAYGAIEGGRAISFLSHSTNEFTLAEWGWVLDEWSQFGPSLDVCSHQQFADTVRDSGLWTDDGDGTYSRTYSSYTDYHALKDSPLIDTGVTIPGYDTDFDGRSQAAYGSAPEIGAFAHPELFPGL